MQTRGKLIMIHGGNGTGKDTIGPRLARALTEANHPATYLYEPQANAACKNLQEIILYKERSPASRYALALTYFAIHAEAIETVLLPRLLAGETLVSNRGPADTLVYNVLASGLAQEYPELLQVYQHQQDTLQPDLTLLFDAPVEIALARAQQGQASTDQFQQHDLEVHQRRREAYLQQAQTEQWRVIDVTPPQDQVLHAALQTCLPIFS